MISAILSNRTFQAYIYLSPPSIKDDFQSKVAQIMNKDTFIVGINYNLYQWGI